MNKNNTLIVALLLCALFLGVVLVYWLWIASQPRDIFVEEVRQVEPSKEARLSVDDAMGLLEIFGTQTAEAMYGTPVPIVTLLPDQKYWTLPYSSRDFSLRFTYSSTHWALTDLRTLASLQINGCTLRVAGGHALGPGWSTEESSLQVGKTVLTTILAKYDTAPQFITYSLIENDVVFEIAAPANFEACRESGEVILKTLMSP